MATRRRRQARKRGSILSSLGLPPISPEVSRSLFGITLLVLGAVTLLAFLPGAGAPGGLVTMGNGWRAFRRR